MAAKHSSKEVDYMFANLKKMSKCVHCACGLTRVLLEHKNNHMLKKKTVFKLF